MSVRSHVCAVVCLFACCLLASVPAAGQGADALYEDDPRFPYRAFINADDVYVRSGPGQNYYPVSRLRYGDAVEVYRHDPGGWYAIRPPADAFSWVSAEFVEPGEGRIATIKGDRVVARVGSNFSDVRDVIQVRLDEGEKVEVLEAKRIGTGTTAQTWYKVAPPAGEFRWVSSEFVDDQAPHREAHQHNPNNNLLIARHARQQDDAAGDDEISPRDREHGESRNRDVDDRDREHPARRSRSRDDYAETRLYQEDEYPHLDRHSHSARAEQPPRDRNGRARGDSDLMAELERLDLALSQEVTKDPSQWDLRPLRLQTDNLLAHSETAIDRGRVRLVQRKIARFEDIKQRADTISTAQLTTDMRNRELVQASLGGSMGVRSDIARFDGNGRLTQVYPAASGVASYALVDREGRIAQFVTPAPGINLQPFVGQDVGVQGTLGYMPDAHTPHVTVKRITPAVAGTWR